MPGWKYLAVACITAAATLAYSRLTLPDTPEAVRAFYRSETKLKQYVDMEAAGEDAIELRKLGAELADSGFTSVRRSGDCTVFYYSMSTASIDTVQEIVFSPKGSAELPVTTQGPKNLLKELRSLKGGWFYIDHD